MFILGLIIGACAGVAISAMCRSSAYDNGYADGLIKFNQGCAEARSEGYNKGYIDGENEAHLLNQGETEEAADEAYECGFADGTEIGFGDAVEHFGFVEVDFDIGPDLTTARYDSRYSSQLKLIETRDAINKTLADKIKVS